MSETILYEISQSIGGLGEAVKGLAEKIEANERRNVDAINQANESRANVHRRLDEITAITSDLNTRTSHLEMGIKTLTGEVSDMRLVTDDVKKMREQARGAGTLGRALLWLGGGVLTGAGWLVAAYTWVTGRPPP